MSYAKSKHAPTTAPVSVPSRMKLTFETLKGSRVALTAIHPNPPRTIALGPKKKMP
jgi:hypothetical protein